MAYASNLAQDFFVFFVSRALYTLSKIIWTAQMYISAQ